MSSFRSHFPRLVFDVLNQLPARCPGFRAAESDVKAGQFALFLFGINVQRHARNRIFINFKNEIVAEIFFNRRPRALDQFLRFDRFFRQQLNRPHVLFHRAADLLVFVGVNQRADAFVGKHLGEQALVHAAVDDVDARHAGLAGGDGVEGLGKLLRARMSLFCSASTDSRSATSICRMSRPWTRMPSCVVMKINLMAFSASATATATPSEFTR